MEKPPGLSPGINPRKRPLFFDDQGKRIKITRLREQAIKLPFEYNIPSIGAGGNWRAARFLGGGMSQAVLWVDVDDSGSMRQCIVRKDTPVATSAWADATKWQDVDLRDNDLRTRVPIEYHVQKAIQDRPEARYVVRVLKCEVDAKRQLYRLYLPYCPYGDLEILVEKYRKDDSFLPQPLLWRIFECLVESGLIMERGGISDDARPTWSEIVHRDLKPANIFLDRESDVTWPKYPIPKLGDYGLAVKTWADDPLNPTIYNGGAGTRGYRPPEQMSFIDADSREPVDDFKLLAHTNVWGVGAIMWSLAHCQILPNDLDYLVTGATERSVGDERTVLLHPDLLGLVRACMRFDPAKRITFQALHRTIQNFISTDADDDGLREYMQQARMGVQEDNDLWDVVNLPRDDYKTDMSVVRR